jgi:hypothetical protein
MAPRVGPDSGSAWLECPGGPDSPRALPNGGARRASGHGLDLPRPAYRVGGVRVLTYRVGGAAGWAAAPRTRRGLGCCAEDPPQLGAPEGAAGWACWR